MIRFGDGELRLLMGVGETDFQEGNHSLQERLSDILMDVECGKMSQKMLVCMPGVLSKFPREYLLNDSARLFWYTFLIKNLERLRTIFLSISTI